MLIPRFVSRKMTALPSPSDDFWYHPVGQYALSGVQVSETSALKYLTVHACVTLIAQDIARLPLILYRTRRNGGKERAPEHPLYDLLHGRPNEETTSFHFREALQGHLLLWGNAFAILNRNSNGTIKDIWQIDDPAKVELIRRGDRLVYRYRPSDGEIRYIDRYDMLHVPGYGFNALWGISVIGAARQAIGLGLAAEEFGQRFFGNGVNPAGVMELDGDLGASREQFLEAIKNQYGGLGKSHSVMVLERGAKYKPLTMPLEDAQFLETRDHQKVEICGLYKVPPHKIALHGQNSNYNNLEQENQSYVDSCLMAWISRWEATINTQLLSEQERRAGYYAEFLVDGMLRGDSASRADFYSKMLSLGAINPDEIRAKENMNPLPDGMGSKYFISANLLPIDEGGMPDQPPDSEPPTEEPPAEPPERAVAAPDLEARSIAVRDRIARRYRALILDAANAIVSREGLTVKRQIKKLADDPQQFLRWLEDYYKGDAFRSFAGQRMGPVLRAFLDSTADASQREIGAAMPEEDLARFVNEYVATYITRHAGSSEGQVRAIVGADAPEVPVEEAVSQRMDEWQETRAEKIADNETVRASAAVFGVIAFAAGRTVKWRTRGSYTCPYCKKLAGRTIQRGGAFVVAGDHIDNDEDPLKGPMTVKRTTKHPPLHQGCDCYLST